MTNALLILSVLLKPNVKTLQDPTDALAMLVTMEMENYVWVGTRGTRVNNCAKSKPDEKECGVKYEA